MAAQMYGTSLWWPLQPEEQVPHRRGVVLEAVELREDLGEEEEQVDEHRHGDDLPQAVRAPRP